jgi:hypothetical protein
MSNEYVGSAYSLLIVISKGLEIERLRDWEIQTGDQASGNLSIA